MEFLETFKTIVRECDYSNTYKMAWAKSIVELSSKAEDCTDEIVSIRLSDIAQKMFKYYWNQTIFFNLLQAAPNQPPVIVSEVRSMITVYKKKQPDNNPVFFEVAENKLKKSFNIQYVQSLRNIVAAIKENVLHRFLNLRRETYNLYDIDLNENLISFKRENLLDLHKNSRDLCDLINYRWGLMLENYNSSPRISKKVRIMDDREIRRGSLTVFDRYLDLENPDHICFQCNLPIADRELSRDHVIPWSYLYSDDIWNLVYVQQFCNSSKSNAVPTDEEISKLKERNNSLLAAMKEANITKKAKDDLELAIENNYVDKFYIGCKG